MGRRLLSSDRVDCQRGLRQNSHRRGTNAGAGRRETRSAYMYIRKINRGQRKWQVASANRKTHAPDQSRHVGYVYVFPVRSRSSSVVCSLLLLGASQEAFPGPGRAICRQQHFLLAGIHSQGRRPRGQASLSVDRRFCRKSRSVARCLSKSLLPPAPTRQAAPVPPPPSRRLLRERSHAFLFETNAYVPGETREQCLSSQDNAAPCRRRASVLRPHVMSPSLCAGKQTTRKRRIASGRSCGGEMVGFSY